MVGLDYSTARKTLDVLFMKIGPAEVFLDCYTVAFEKKNESDFGGNF